jgi:catechol 2,3-dioxygenase-like lactoylglutathione lyase family enzyme
MGNMRHRKLLLALGIVTSLALAGTSANAGSGEKEVPAPVTAVAMMAASLSCSDLERSIAFYTMGLGMTLGGRIDMPSGTEAPLMFPGGGAYIILFKPKVEGTSAATRNSSSRIILTVPDIKALEAKLVAAGYHLSAAIAQQAKYHVAVGQIEDPDGNHLELVQRLP